MDSGQQFMLLADPLSINWDSQGDEWLTGFENALIEQQSDVRMTGYRVDINTAPCLEIETIAQSSPKQAQHLLIGFRDGAVLLLVRANEGDIGVPTPIQEAWLRAARTATESLGRNGIEYQWSAIVGPAVPRIMESRVGIDCEGLTTPGTFGQLSFESAGRQLVEFATIPQNPSFTSGATYGSIPILVRGVQRGYTWENASVTVAQDLNRACGLLAVAWGVCMVIRESPAPLVRGLRVVPERSPSVPENFVPHVTTDPRVDREIPRWAQSAWEAMLGCKRLEDAVAAYHEGTKVEYTNPTLALVAFISSIEAISQLVFCRDRCKACDPHKGIRARFAETLRLMLSAEKAERLELLYPSRSKAVHSGRMYGFESLVGSFQMGMWSRDPRRDFWMDSVYPMREASRSILTIALKQELPKKRHLSSL